MYTFIRSKQISNKKEFIGGRGINVATLDIYILLNLIPISICDVSE